jgi:hypothetical protein
MGLSFDVNVIGGNGMVDMILFVMTKFPNASLVVI